MNTINSNRRHALKLLLAGPLTATATLAVTGCESLPAVTRGRTDTGTDGEPLSRDVRSALLKHPSTAQLQLAITTVGDEVIIKGYVPNKNDIYNIEQVAIAVPGVRHVLMDVYVNN